MVLSVLDQILLKSSHIIQQSLSNLYNTSSIVLMYLSKLIMQESMFTLNMRLSDNSFCIIVCEN